jgi:hypothetical protein
MARLAILSLIVALSTASFPDTLPNVKSLDKGVAFIPQSPILLQTSDWSLIVDISISSYRIRVSNISALLHQTSAITL